MNDEQKQARAKAVRQLKAMDQPLPPAILKTLAYHYHRDNREMGAMSEAAFMEEFANEAQRIQDQGVTTGDLFSLMSLCMRWIERRIEEEQDHEQG